MGEDELGEEERDLTTQIGVGGDGSASHHQRELSFFDRKMEESKNRRKRRRPKDRAVVEEEVLDFIAFMMRVRDDDLKAYRKNTPALNKVKSLPHVEEMLKKIDYRETLLQNDLLPVIRSWLDPMPDNTLPNLTVRSRLLELLSEFPVNEEWLHHLERSRGLGKVVNYLSMKDPHEPNSRLAKALVEKWSRPIFEQTAREEEDELDYRDAKPRMEQSQRDLKAKSYVSRKMNDSLGQALKNMARVPEKVSFASFARRPDEVTQLGEEDAEFGKRRRSVDKKASRAPKLGKEKVRSYSVMDR
uniref:TFIIS N-terminal domain-containing protein n=1 Tax=Compsopogon caeruleus TaxID=31354 RepID=A0A6T6C574_9RHOD